MWTRYFIKKCSVENSENSVPELLDWLLTKVYDKCLARALTFLYVLKQLISEKWVFLVYLLPWKSNSFPVKRYTSFPASLRKMRDARNEVMEGSVPEPVDSRLLSKLGPNKIFTPIGLKIFAHCHVFSSNPLMVQKKTQFLTVLCKICGIPNRPN